MPQICVAHLVRRHNGPATLAAFLSSYKEHPAGVPHELLLICKGFEREVLPDEYTGLLKDLPHRQFFVEDEGFDILAYLKAARTFAYEYFVPLNSFSAIL